MKPSGITLEDVRKWAKDMENWNLKRLFEETFDENVEWTFSSPSDGPLGQTSPVSGVYTSREQVMKHIVTPIMARFVEPRFKYELIDLFIQPSEMNDPAERHLTKAVVELKASGVLKKNRQDWVNYIAYILHFDNQTKKVVKLKSYQDSAAINKAFEE
ncbi:hypothetical protein FRB94_003273 [Tulasnella sp. JGI-2019a]|nr:hypothetical protein FRB93_003066 [Tulasnella sp. JGI-2019a]KAG9013203.1 hypothetical protein FRB94_003273 [Tulasnella sp. JGI-2019a]KAG9033015.1 hypothetical protein FRB95_000677 [Tulasnella sp. JGI-2019a]